MEMPEEMKTDLAVLKNDVLHIKEKVDHIDSCLERDYVTRTEFEPIKRLVYGLVALTMTSVVVAILMLVLRGVH